MREINLYPYILLGDSIRFLSNVREGLPIKQALTRNGLSLYDHMSRIFNELWHMDLAVTQEAFEGELGGISQTFYELPEDSQEKLTAQQASLIVEGMKVIVDILKYESMKLQAYIVAEKRLPVKRLLSEIDELFGENVFVVLPDLAQYDFRQAGKCIAFEVPTAAAFHTLRGTEDVLRGYYTGLVAPITTFLNWGDLTKGLRGITVDAPPKNYWIT